MPDTAVGADWFDDREPRSWVDEFQEMPIEELNLSMRAYNCLRRSGIMTVGQVMERSPRELLALRNFGAKSFREVWQRLLDLSEPQDLPNS
jgi:DNA-directed RNA polymerase alpha subunit